MNKSKAFWGVLLIAAGILLVVATTDMIRIDIIGSLFTLYPLLIIAAGASFFLNREKHMLRVAMWVLVFAIIGGYGIYLGYQNVELPGGTTTFDMRNDIRSAKFQADLGAADVRIASTTASLAKLDSNIPNLQSKTSGSSEANIRVSQKSQLIGTQRGSYFSLDLNNTIPWELEFNTGAIDGMMDLSDLSVKSCDINTGACDLRLIMGDKQNESLIRCNGGAVDISLTIPKGTGVKIQSSSAVSDVRGNGVKINKDGRSYYSEGFDSADRTVVVEVNSGATQITVNVQ